MSHGERGGEAHPLAGILEQIRNPVAIALETFDARDTLRPVLVPPRPYFADKGGLDTWRKGGAAPKGPDGTTAEFSAWLAEETERVKALSENERRLRTTLWAQATLEANGEPERAQALGRWHREHWRIGGVSGDSAERELQLKRVIAGKARGL